MVRIGCTALIGALALCAQTGLYQFPIDQDALSGAPDFSFLNHPLTAADRIVVCGAHFCRAGDGQRVRFFGVNLAFSANFPDPADMPRIAKRLRRLGVNLVRLHHMDSQPDSNPQNAGSTLTTGPYPTLNTVSVPLLRGFLTALAAEGIYCDLNLHVGYTFRPSVDNVPAMPAGVAFPTQSKPLHIFYPRMVSLQAQYAQSLIAALSLKNDPVLAMVEIDNETSLVQAWQSSGLDEYLLGAYQTEFQRQWNVFLAAKYPSTAALVAAWGATQPNGPELLHFAWQPEIHAPAQATMAMTTTNGLPTVSVNVSKSGNPVIIKQVGFDVAAGGAYTAQVEMRADIPDNTSAAVYWDVKRDVSPWDTEFGRNVSITNQWQTFTMSFQAPFAMTGTGRFGLSVENVPGTAYIRNWSFHQAGRLGLAAGQTVEAGNVALVGEDEIATLPRANDYLLFLVNRDRAYVDQIQTAIRGGTDALVPVTGTQMGYGGLLNIDSQADLNYQDNHFYVDHYNFPNVQWDGFDWRIQDASALTGGLSAFQNMAISHQAARPYTVSEYNQPWPNTYSAAIDPTLAAFAAFQDWDAIIHFAYSHSRSWDDGVPEAFNLTGDFTKVPGLGQAAWLFRSGAIQTGKQPVEIPVSLDQRLESGREKQDGNIAAYLATVGYQPMTAFTHPVRVADGTGAMPNAATAPATPILQSDTGELTFDTAHSVYLINSAAAAGIFGFVGSAKYTAGPLDVQTASSARGFVSLLLTPIDGRPLLDSEHLLLSNPGYTLRSQPGANPVRPQNLVNYPGTNTWYTLEKEPGYLNKPSGDMNAGIKPVWMERVECYATFRTRATRLTVFPLDGTGKRLKPLSEIERTSSGVRIHLQADGQPFSPWYEIVVTSTRRHGAP